MIQEVLLLMTVYNIDGRIGESLHTTKELLFRFFGSYFDASLVPSTSMRCMSAISDIHQIGT